MIKDYLKKQYFILVLALSALFIISTPPSFIQENEETENISNIEYQKDVSPEELYMASYKIIKENYWNKPTVKEVLPHWKKRYSGKIKTEDDAKIAINSMLQSLDDPYSKFLDKKDCEELSNSINSKVYGIGINIDSNAGKVTIINVIKGAPAYNSGLMAGDIITSVNNEDTNGKNLFEVANLIKNPKYNTIKMEILRGNKKLVKNIKKEEIKVKTVKSEILDKEIGYIKISSFISSETPVEFIEAMNKIKDTKALILDLRGNTGGLFQNALFVSDMFLKDKNIVYVLGRGGQKSVYKSKKEGYIYENPMVVLVDFESASASEIVSGALKDNNRAKIIGTKTFGKGLVQKTFPMPNNTAINLTIARYLTPKSIDINKKGISPDYYIEITQDDIDKNRDKQLNFALKTLKIQIERDRISKHQAKF